jgi:hypothetical protein
VRRPSTRWPVSHGKPLILRPTHEAVIEDRPLFKAQVLDASEVDRVLIPADNNCKLGSHWSKGPWIGAPIFTLTLAERSTCPRTCLVRDACMGRVCSSDRYVRYYNASPDTEGEIEIGPEE